MKSATFIFINILVLIETVNTPGFSNDFGIILTKPIRKVAIIGAGMAGSSTAFLLKKMFFNKILVDVYEKDQIGGRLFSYKIDGNDHEIGEWVITRDESFLHYYIRYFRKTLYTITNGGTMLYDGKDAEHVALTGSLLDVLSSLWNFAYAMFVTRLYAVLNRFPYDRLKDNLDKKIGYTTVEQMVAETAPDMLYHLNIDIKDAMIQSGITEYSYEKYAKAYVRRFTGFQDKVHILAGQKSLYKSMYTEIYVLGGMKSVCEAILKASHTDVLFNEVYDIVWEKMSEKFRIRTLNGISKLYDNVIIATPLVNNIGGIDFLNFPQPILLSDNYDKLYFTLVEGDLKLAFNYKSYPVDKIFSTNEKLFFVAIYKVRNTYNKKNGNRYHFPVWKIVSKHRLNTDHVYNLFYRYAKIENLNKVIHVPSYYNLERNASFVLFPNLFYVNAIEWLDTSLDTLIMGAKNVANLIFINHIKAHESNIQNEN